MARAHVYINSHIAIRVGTWHAKAKCCTINHK